MLIMRFQRIGRKNDPAFRVVVTERRSKPRSGGVEILGSYHPKTKELVLKNERILYWLSQGAKASPTVHNLLISKGIIKGKKIAKGMVSVSLGKDGLGEAAAGREGGEDEVKAVPGSDEVAPQAT